MARSRGSASWRASGGSVDATLSPGVGMLNANTYLQPDFPVPEVDLSLEGPFGYETDGSNRVTTVYNTGSSGRTVTATPKAGGATVPAPREGVITDGNGLSRDLALRLTTTTALRINNYTFPTGDFTNAWLGYPNPRTVGANAVADIISDGCFFDASAPQTYRLSTSNADWRLQYYDGSNLQSTQGAVPLQATAQASPGVPWLMTHSYNSTSNLHNVWLNGENYSFTAPMTRGFTDLTIGPVNNSSNPTARCDWLRSTIWASELTPTQRMQLWNYLLGLYSLRYTAIYIFGTSIVSDQPGGDGGLDAFDSVYRGTWNNYQRLLSLLYGNRSRSRSFVRTYGRSGAGLVSGATPFNTHISTILSNVTESVHCYRRVCVIDAMFTNDIVTGQTPAQCLTNVTTFLNALLADGRFDRYIYITDIARATFVGASNNIYLTNQLLKTEFSPGGSLHALIAGAGKTIQILDMGALPEFDVLNPGGVITSAANTTSITVGGSTFSGALYNSSDPTPYSIHPSKVGTMVRAMAIVNAFGDLTA